VRTTVNIDDELLAEAKILAARSHRSLGTVIDDALRAMLSAGDQSDARGRVVLPTDGGSGLQPGVDLEDKDALSQLLGDNARAGAPR
jgi:plasmid stability protein